MNDNQSDQQSTKQESSSPFSGMDSKKGGIFNPDDTNGSLFSNQSSGQQESSAATSEESNATPPSTSVAALSLRALFGSTQDLGIDQLLEKSSTLRSIKSVGVLSGDEVAALNVIHQYHLGLEECRDLRLVCSSGIINFVHHGKTTLVIVVEGGYAPGMKDALQLVAQRIDELQ